MTLEPPSDSFLPTRQSLLTRLKDWNDQEGWREFFDTYWRLIYMVARRAGLSEAASQDVVQETMLVVAKQMPAFRYDPQRGSFKAWLHTVIRGRLCRHWRKQKAPEVSLDQDQDEENGPCGPELAAPAEFDAIWQTEWEQNLIEAALRRVQTQVSPRQYLLFSLAALKNVPASVICERYDANMAQLYLAKHRVGRLFKKELARLQKDSR
jgi:RNA polymerase sigma factor (sigma-70 family)